MANRAYSSDSSEEDDEGCPELIFRHHNRELIFRHHNRSYLEAWIKRMADEMEMMKDEMDAVKRVPPVEIIKFEDLIKKAWSPARLVPWSSGKVLLRDYLDYLQKFFKNHPSLRKKSNPSLRYDLHAAAKLCLEMERKYIESGNVHDEKLSLEIMDAAKKMKNEAKKMKNEGKTEGESAVAIASLMCIAAEAKLMSKLLKTDTKSLKLSNNIRRYALDKMTYNGPESVAFAGSILGISKEAKKVCKYIMKPINLTIHTKLEVCFYVRESTLCFLHSLEHHDLVTGNTVNSDVNALDKPTSELNSDEAVAESEKNKKRKEMGVTKELEKKKRRLSSSCTYRADEKA